MMQALLTMGSLFDGIGGFPLAAAMTCIQRALTNGNEPSGESAEKAE